MRVALLTVSDSASTGAQSDLSGPLLHKLVAEGGRTVIRAEIVADDRKAIAEWLCRAADVYRVDLVLTSGGTGLSPRDVTPEATRDVVDFEAPGIAEAIRAAGIATTARAMLSRNVAGVRKKTLIINLSGSPKAVVEQWGVVEPVIEHAVETVHGSGHHPVADVKRKPSPASYPSPQDQPPIIIDQRKPPGQWHNTLVGTPVEEILSELEKKKSSKSEK